MGRIHDTCCGFLFVFVGVVLVSLIDGNVFAGEKGAFKDQSAKKSYAVGVDTARSSKDLSFELDADLVADGIKDAYTGKTKLSEEELRSILDNIKKDAQQKRAEKVKNIAEKNRIEGEAFMKENIGRAGFASLESGLQYRVVKEGKGRMPQWNDTIVVHYRGAFINGSEFDNTYVRKQPMELVVNDKLILGWTQVLLKMKEGSRWLVILPPALAYGEKGNGPIGPNSTLMFDIELLRVKRK